MKNMNYKYIEEQKNNNNVTLCIYTTSSTGTNTVALGTARQGNVHNTSHSLESFEFFLVIVAFKYVVDVS